MGTPTGQLLVNDLALFIFDRSRLRKESDRIEDAVKYYHPKEDFLLEKVKERCRQLIGISDCVMHLTGTRPRVLSLKCEKYALKEEGDYGIALSGKTSDENSALVDKLEKLYDIFVFYHGSLHHVHEQMEGDDKCFTDRLAFIWSHYYHTKEEKQSSMHPVFHPLPYLDLPKTGCQFFVKASQILQSCQRQKGVLAGCILYNKSVLYTQLPPALTEKLLVCATRSSSQKTNFTIKAGFRLPNFIRLYALFLTASEYEVFRRCRPENTRELLSELIPPLETSLMQTPFASQISHEGRERTKSSSSVNTASPSSPSLLSRSGGHRLSLTKQQPRVIEAVSPPPKTKQHLLPSDSPLEHDLKDRVTTTVTVKGTTDGDRRVDVNKEQQRDRCSSQCGMVKETTPVAVCVPCCDCENTNVEVQCNGRDYMDRQTQSGCASCSPPSLVSNHIDGQALSDCAACSRPSLALNHIDGQAESGRARASSSPPSLASNRHVATGEVNEPSASSKCDRAESSPPSLSSSNCIISNVNRPTEVSDEERHTEDCSPQPISVGIHVSPTRPTPILNYEKTEGSGHQQASLPNAFSATPSNSMLSSSLQTSFPSFDPSQLSACSSYDSLAEVEQPTEPLHPSRTQSPGSGDSVYLDCCHPSEESSSSPSPQLPPTHASPPNSVPDREIISLHGTDTDSKPAETTGFREREDVTAPEQIDETDKPTVDDSVGESETTESAPQIRNVNRQESVFSGSSLTLSSFSDVASDVPDLGGEEKGEEDKVDGITRATLYIQAPEHSNLMLLLVADSQLEREEETVRCLWEGSLIHMADLAVNLKECVSHLSSRKPVSSFYYASYNGYEKTLNTNCFHTTSRNARSFVQVTKALQKQHNSNSDITDLVLRYPATCSAYARFSLGKEIYFEPRVAQPARLVAPPGSPELRDISAADDTVGFNIEVTARTKLSDEASINLV